MRLHLSGLTVLCVGALAALFLIGTGDAVAATRHRVSLRLAAPTRIPPDRTSVLSGRLIDRSTGHAIADARVRFYYWRPGQGSWKALGTARTNWRGSYRQAFDVPSTVAFTTRFAGSRRFRSAWSPTRWVRMPANGTEAWNTHYHCRYTVVSGRWYGDYCVADQTQSVINIYDYNSRSAMRAGALRYQLRTNFPNFIVWRDPNDTEFRTVAWAAVPRSNPTAEPQLWVDFEGRWQWITKSGLIALIQRLEAIIAAQGGGTLPASSNLVTVGGASEGPWAFTDLANGIDRLSGNAQLAQTFSSIYTIDPLTLGRCGEYGYRCYALP